MADLSPGKNPQKPSSDSVGIQFYYFITNQRNLLSFLSSGMITPSACQFRYREDSRKLVSGAIPFWKEGVPVDISSDVQLTGRQSVIVEYSKNDIDRYGINCTAYEDDTLFVINAPVPLKLVTALYMPSQESIDDFLLRITDDVIFDPALFHEAPIFQELYRKAELPKIEPINDISPVVMMLDSFAGGISSIRNHPNDIGQDIFCVIPTIITFLDTLSPATLNWDKPSSDFTLSDQTLLSCLAQLLNEHKEENGFDPSGFVTRLESSIRSSEGNIPEELLTWFSYVRAVINAEKEIKPLNDEGHIIQRAVLLFILRPELERLIKSTGSSVAPGPKVLLVALFFAGFASGITRMSAEFKNDFLSYNGFVKSIIDALWNKNELNMRLSKHSIGQKVFEVNGEVLLEAKAKQDPVLAQVLEQAHSLGYEMDYDFENDELIYEVLTDEGLRQTVHIERLILSDYGNPDIIKFVSSCAHLAPSKMQRLRKDQLLDLLFRNDSDNTLCSYALSKKRKALVAEATWVANTMSDTEFTMTLSQVAKVAANYNSI